MKFYSGGIETSSSAQLDSSTERDSSLTATSYSINATNYDLSPKEDGSSTAIPIPDALVYKYNRYVDGIFDKINRILKRAYDPVNVRLSTAVSYKAPVKKTGTKKSKG